MTLTDTEINRLVAKDVMNLCLVFQENKTESKALCGTCWRQEWMHENLIKDYCNSWEEAMGEVRIKIFQLRFSVRKSFTVSLQRIVSTRLGATNLIHHSEVFMRLTPKDVALAALKAKGVDVCPQ